MKTAGLMIDFQDRILNVMSGRDLLVKNTQILLNGLKILNINLITSEQNPQKLGATSEIFSPFLGKIYAKNEFSCLGNEALKDEILKFDHLIVFGIEAHICVLQSVKDLLKMGKKVTLLANATASRDEKDKQIALNLMANLGAEISCVESVLFEILKTSEHQNFKEISKLIR